ncbi:MAG TPA: metallophosphoesterase family protein [Pirellulales bacterium]|jgi:3',5'-cyclic AMP phosphodiesterase CpdA|nr:metallophosphoesterase family protein [Pirellulales bacterium]
MRDSQLPAWQIWLATLTIAWFGSGDPPVAAYEGDEAHEHFPPAADLKEVYKPTVLPDRIILTWAGDPAFTQAVTWRTSTEVARAWAEIAVADADPAFAKSATRIAAASQALLTDLGTAHYHTVRFKGLTPSKKYAYRVGDGVNWSEWFHFTTASDKAEPFSFIYFGDAQNDIRSMWSRVIREAYSDAPKAGFMIHAGDLINKAEADAEWGAWFGAGAWLNAMLPSVPVPGNHEQAADEDGGRRLSHHWRPQFALPKNGPIGLEETCYTFVYQGARIIGLNSNEQIEQQAAWVDRVLAENDCSWVVCTFHHPIFSTGKDRDNPALRAAWKPIFDKYRVDVVLQGHDHTYGRTGLATPVAAAPETPVAAAPATPETVGNVPAGVNKFDEQTGTVYVVSVSGPKMYKLQRQPFMPRQAENTQLYQIIQIEGGKLRYEARTAVGEIYDAFTLLKRSGEINELIEQIPDTPARIAPEETPPLDSSN